MKAEKNKVIEELVELRCKRGYSSTSLVNYLKETYDGMEMDADYFKIAEARIESHEEYRSLLKK